MAQSLRKICVHPILSTKRRERLLLDPFRSSCDPSGRVEPDTMFTQGFATVRSAQPWADLLRPVWPPHRVSMM